MNSVNQYLESGQQQKSMKNQPSHQEVVLQMQQQDFQIQNKQQKDDNLGNQSGSSVFQHLSLSQDSYKKLISLLSKHGLPTQNPILRLDVIPQQPHYTYQRAFQLIKSDVEQVLKVFGEIKEVTIEPQQGFALVTFQDIVSAFFAQQSLNNYYLSKYNANLQVKWINNNQNSPKNIQEQAHPEYIQQNQENISQQNYYYNNQNQYQNQYCSYQYSYNQNYKQNQYKQEEETIKYTCRFDIQIDNEKEFQVARRLIGPRGTNMKKIIESCCKQQNYDQYQEIVKLRLRGKGSGFKEGPNKEESNEPLHLCVSSKYYDKYLIACNQVEELILGVYDEYYRFCDKYKKNNIDLPIKKVETVTGRRPVGQTPTKMFQQSQGKDQMDQRYMYQFGQNNQQFTPYMMQRSQTNELEGEGCEEIMVQRSYSHNVQEMWNQCINQQNI